MKISRWLSVFLLLFFVNYFFVAPSEVEFSEDVKKSTLHSGVLESMHGHLLKAKRSTAAEGRMYQHGCTDSFSIFGFLAFLLALLDLVLELQAADMMGGTRRKRSTDALTSTVGGTRRNRSTDAPTPTLEQENDGMSQEWNEQESNIECSSLGPEGASVASYSLLRGFLNALGTSDPECAKRYFCEGAQEATAVGPLGKVFAQVASLNAETWLIRVNKSLYKDIAIAGGVGTSSTACSTRYSGCVSSPPSYRQPGIPDGLRYLEESNYVPELLRELFGGFKDVLKDWG